MEDIRKSILSETNTKTFKQLPCCTLSLHIKSVYKDKDGRFFYTDTNELVDPSTWNYPGSSYCGDDDDFFDNL